MTSNKGQPSKVNFFYSVALFIIGITLYYSKRDSLGNIRSIQYTGLICILSSFLSIFVTVMTWIRYLQCTDDKIIQVNATSNKGLTISNSESENKIDTLSVNNEDTIKNNSSQLTRKSWSAPVKTEFFEKMSDKNIFNNFDKGVNHITVPIRPSSSNN